MGKRGRRRGDVPAAATTAVVPEVQGAVPRISARQRDCAGLIYATLDGLPREWNSETTGKPGARLGGMHIRFAHVEPQSPLEVPSCLAIEPQPEGEDDEPQRVWVSSLHPTAPVSVLMLQSAEMQDAEAAAVIRAFDLR